MPTTSLSSRPGHRLDWIDAARGVGILLVVYGHAIRGVEAANMYHAPTLVVQDAVIYAFHMPLFFFVSGLFAGRRPGDTTTAFLKSRLITLVWPYLLWSLVQGLLNIAVGAATGPMVNKSTSWTELLSILWDPIGQFWFLYALFLCQLLLLLPRRLFFLAAICAALFSGLFRGNIVANAIGDLPFFAAGVWLNAHRATQISASPRRTAVAGVVAWLLFVALIAAGGMADGTPASRPIHLATGFAGTIGTLCLARIAVDQIPTLATLGAASMPIYLLHVLFSAGVRIAIAALHLHVSGLLLLVLVTGVGVLGPLLVYAVSERLGWSAVLGFGRARKRPPAEGRRKDDAFTPLEPVSANADVGATKRA
jgi:fucose 4-O-acetylase-like acetyltransferase